MIIKTGILFLMTLPIFLTAYTLNINVKDIDTTKKGQVIAKIFKEHEQKGFPLTGGYSIKFDPKNKQQQIFFRGLNKGHYAIVIFHDENNNNRLDKNSFGFKEGVGYSNNYIYFPSFNKSKVSIVANQVINIKLNY